MRSDTTRVIRMEVEHIFGRKIVSSRDCNQLSEEIEKKTKIRLNPNTLRRFFGLVKSEYPSSISTLNILSNYCGFRSVEDLYELKSRQITETGFVEQASLLNYMVSIFSESPEEEANSEIFRSIVKHTIKFLASNSSLVEKFQCLIAKTKNGQDFYFEQFINIDGLNTFYGDGLRYYLNEKKTAEAQIFGYSLLVLRYWLTKEQEKLKTCFAELLVHQSGQSLNPAVYGRCFASRLFEASVTGASPSGIISDIYKYYSSLRPSHDYTSSLCAFETVVAEALVLTGYNDDALFYTNKAIQKYANTPVIKTSTLQGFYLFQAIALSRIGENKDAEQYFQMIVPSEFSFLNKKYFTILYLYLMNIFKRKVSKYEEQMADLLSETGFSALGILFGGEDIPETVNRKLEFEPPFLS